MANPRGSRFDARAVSRFKKERFLRSLSESEFRDQVVRPLFLKKGLLDGRDTCGPTEEGKDAVFVAVDKLGIQDFYAVQTKKGNLTMASKPSRNLPSAIAQLRTALETPVIELRTKAKKRPSKVILCASGKINKAAQSHILDAVPDPRIAFLDSDALIPEIDEIMPELWFGVDAEKYPYLVALREFLVRDTPGESHVGHTSLEFNCPATDEACASLSVVRISRTMRRVGGQRRPGKAHEPFPVTALIRRPERLLLLLGDAGFGKSTSLRRIAYVLADKGMAGDSRLMIPVLLKAADLTAASASLVEVAATKTAEVSGKKSPAFDMKDLSEGNVTILIDALDELADPKEREQVVRVVRDFVGDHAKCQVILATRQYSWLTELQGIHAFAWFRLVPIGWRETTNIVERLRKRKRLSAEKTKEVLRRLQDVHGLELSPLLVTVFVATSDFSRADVPANITELFKKYTEMMLGRWDAEKGLAQQYLAPLKDYLLCQVAAEMHRRSVTAIPLSDLEDHLTSELESRDIDANAKTIVAETLRSGLFRILGDTVEFAHLLVQEFFAGRGMKEEEISGALPSFWWQRPLMFYFGENPNEGRLLQSMVTTTQGMHGDELAQSAVTLGLSVQACYLLTRSERLDVFVKVIEGLSRAGVEQFGADPKKGSVLEFLLFYVWGRDAVSCDVVRKNAPGVSSALQPKGRAERDQAEFWQIVSLMECGLLSDALKRVKSFRPKDTRLQMALHLGAALFLSYRVATNEDKKVARRICSELGPSVEGMRKRVLKELAEQRRTYLGPGGDSATESEDD